MDDLSTQTLITLIKKVWASPDFAFLDTERVNGLREQILKNLLALTMTDDERAGLLGLPDGCRIRETAKIISPEKFRCGTNVWIGENCILDASGGLTVGDHTSISVGSLIWSHESVMSNLMMDNGIGNPWITRKPTTIGSGCYIGGPCSIYAGVTLGNHVVVLPMSTVTTDVPDRTMVGGSPARKIRDIDDEWIKQYRSSNGL